MESNEKNFKNGSEPSALNALSDTQKNSADSTEMPSNGKRSNGEPALLCPACKGELAAPYCACPHCGLKLKEPKSYPVIPNGDSAANKNAEENLNTSDNSAAENINDDDNSNTSDNPAAEENIKTAENSNATAYNVPNPNNAANSFGSESRSVANGNADTPQRPPMVTAVPRKVCPVCSTVYPETQAICPKCGYAPYANTAAERKAQRKGGALYKKWWFWLIVGTVIFAVCLLLISLIPRSAKNDKFSFDKITENAKWFMLYDKQLEVRVQYSASMFPEDYDMLVSLKNTTDKAMRVVPSGASIDGRAACFTLLSDNDDDFDNDEMSYFDLAPGESRSFNAYFTAEISTSDDSDSYDSTDGISHNDIRIEFEMYSPKNDELIGTTGQLKIQTESEPQDSLKQFKGKTAYEDNRFLVTSVKIDQTYYLTVKNKTDKSLRVNADKLRLFGYVLPTDIVGYDTGSILGGATAVFTVDSTGLPSGELSMRLIYSVQELPQNAYESSTDSFICIP